MVVDGHQVQLYNQKEENNTHGLLTRALGSDSWRWSE